MIKRLSSLLIAFTILFFACDDNDLKNTNILSQDEVDNIETAIKNNEIYVKVQEAMANAPDTIIILNDTITGEYLLTYFNEHQKIRVPFEESVYYRIFNRRIKNALVEELKEKEMKLSDECKEVYSKSAYSVSFNVYAQSSRLLFEYKQYVLLDVTFKVLDMYCVTSDSKGGFLNVDLPCK